MAAFESAQALRLLDVPAATAAPTTIRELRDGKPLVLDLWHVKCVRCPAALTKLDGLARAHPGVKFAACALSLCDKPDGPSDDEVGQQDVIDLIDDMWENLTHCYMSLDEKLSAKAELGFTSVPYCVVFGADGTILFKGDPTNADLEAVLSPKPAPAVATKKVVTPVTNKKPLGEVNRDLEKPLLSFGNDDDDF